MLLLWHFLLEPPATGGFEFLFKITMLLEKQGLEFRGHRDDRIVLDEQHDQELLNPGNFKVLVRFRAETDPYLTEH